MNGYVRVRSSANSVVRENDINFGVGGYALRMYYGADGIVEDNNINCQCQGGVHFIEDNSSCLNNEIELVPHVSLGQWGVRLLNSGGNQVSGNTISLSASSSPFLSNNSAIFEDGTDNLRIEHNTLLGGDRGISIGGGTGHHIEENFIDSRTGIRAAEGPDLYFECNIINASSDAIHIGSNAEGQDFFGNSLAGGRDLFIGSLVGIQRHRGNKFFGGNTTANLSQSGLINSRFFVNSTYSNLMPSSPNPSNGWFVDEPLVHNFFKCTGSPGGGGIWETPTGCDLLFAALETHGANSPQFVNLLDNAIRISGDENYLYNCDPIEDPVPPNCWLIKTIERDLLSERDLDYPTLPNLDNARALMVAIQSAVDPYELVDYANQMTYITSEMHANFSTYLTSRISELEQAIEVSCPTDEDDPIRKVRNEIYVEYAEFTLSQLNESEYDFSTMQDYARLCADMYGRVIHIARGVASLYKTEDYTIYDDCLSSESRLKQRALANTKVGKVYPNPSTGKLNLGFDTKVNAYVIVKDMTGRVILSKKIVESNNLELNLSNSHGVHLIEIKYDSGEVELHQAIILE